MTIAEWVGIISVALIILGMAVSFNKEIAASELRCKTAITEVIKSANVSRWNDEEKFVEVKVCKIEHKNTDEKFLALNKKIDEVSADVKKLLAKAGIS